MKVSCIIPAYNEEKRIGGVLDIVTQCLSVNEVVVVDDSSWDSTTKVVEKYPQVILLKHSTNNGKSLSVYDGIKKSTGDVLLLLDADLLCLSVVNLEDIISPVIRLETDIALSLRGNSPWFWKFIGIDYISGERCFRRDFLNPYVEEIKSLNSFALEIFLNKLIIKNQLKIKVVHWPKVKSPFKRKFFGVYFDFLIMGVTIIKEISIFKIVSQIINLRRLMV